MQSSTSSTENGRIRKSDAIHNRFELLGVLSRVLILLRQRVSIQTAVREQA